MTTEQYQIGYEEGYQEGWNAAMGEDKVAPMSADNRLIAYSAAEKLGELGFVWDEESLIWLSSPTPPAEQQTQPEAIAKLRHLYKNLMCNGVRSTEDAKRIAQGLLAPAIEALERVAPPAEQQAPATEGYVQPVPDKCDRITWRGRYYHLPLTEQSAPKAAPGETKAQRFRSLLDYDPKTGIFTWKVARGGMPANSEAGYVHTDKYGNKYRCIKIDGKIYQAQRVVFMYCFGLDLGKFEVDHIDGDTFNNAISNLRIVTHKQNSENRKLGMNNKSGYMGVSWSKNDEAWIASIKHYGKSIFLGSFETAELAHKAYEEKRAELFTHGEGRHLAQPAPAPLSDEQIANATGAEIGTPLFLAAKGFVLATEAAHGITQKGGSNVDT